MDTDASISTKKETEENATNRQTVRTLEETTKEERKPGKTEKEKGRRSR
jgi:hypothetical protein